MDHMVYGRSPSLPVQSIGFMIRHLLSSHALFPIASVIFGCSVFYDMIRKKREAVFTYKVMAAFFLASLVMYIVSEMVLLKLFLPAKYVRYSFVLIGLLVVALGIGFILERIPWARGKKAGLVAVILAGYCWYGPKSLFLYDPALPWTNHVQGVSPNVDQRAYKDFYAYIARLPKDVMIAANPYLSDYISTFSERKTFLKYELSYPWFDRYTQTVEKRMLDFYKSYYALSFQDLYDFCRQNRIDYLAVDLDDFDRAFLASNDFGLSFVNQQVREAVRRKQRFAIEEIKKRKIVYRTDDQKIFLVPVSRLGEVQ
jgi:hypothetical protein